MLHKAQPQGAVTQTLPVLAVSSSHGECSLEQTSPTTAFWKDSGYKGCRSRRTEVTRGLGSGCQGDREGIGQHRCSHRQLGSMDKCSELVPPCSCVHVLMSFTPAAATLLSQLKHLTCTMCLA